MAFLALSMALAGCNPKAIPTVIFPAKPEQKAEVVKPPAAPGNAIVNIFARDIINPSPDGSPSPVQVRVFVTDDQAPFDDVTFEQVFEFNGQRFDLKPKFTGTLKPGSVDSVAFELLPEQSIIAIAVAFRDIGRTEWLKLVRIDSSKSTSINFILSEFTVEHESEMN